jgi:hypothetical protein
VQTFIMIPAQIITAGRRMVYRVLAWNPGSSPPVVGDFLTYF